MLSRQQQHEFDKLVTSVVSRMRAREFTNTLALSQAFGRERSWSAFMQHVVVDRLKVMTLAEWHACFTERFKKINQWECPRCQYRGKLKQIVS